MDMSAFLLSLGDEVLNYLDPFCMWFPVDSDLSITGKPLISDLSVNRPYHYTFFNIDGPDGRYYSPPLRKGMPALVYQYP